VTQTDQIRTERLILRAPITSDAAAITRYISVKDVVWNLGTAPYPYHLKDAQDWITRSSAARVAGADYPFIIDLPGDGVIGCVGIRLVGEVYELGYWLGQPWWGRGYVSEAAAGLMHWAEQTLGAQAFMAGHYVDNPASGRVLEKLGFEAVGIRDLFGKARGVKAPAKRYVRGAPPEAALEFGAHD